MKKIAIIKYLSISLLFFSCTKTVENNIAVDNPSLSKQTNTALQSIYLVKDLDSTKLTITLNPVVSCYSYKNGETPKPCNILIDINCVLSKPVQGFIKIEIEKVNDNGANKAGAGNLDPSQHAIVFNIAPNTTHITLSSTFTNPNNQDVVDTYRIAHVTVYNIVN